MNKYFALAKIFFTSAMIKQADIVGNLVNNMMQIWAILLIWLYVYNPKQPIAGFSLQETIIYYVVILLVTYLTYSNTADYIAQNIKMGTLSEWLLRPRNILLTELSRAFGEQLYRLLILLPIYFIIVFSLNVFNVRTILTWQGISLGFIFMIFGFLVNCLFEYTLAMFSFWIDEVWSIKHFKEVVTDLLGGKRVPLAFFPVFIQQINKFLPFQFVYFIPAEYVLNKHTFSNNLREDLLFACFWIMFFIIAASILFKKGVKKYGAFGN